MSIPSIPDPIEVRSLAAGGIRVAVNLTKVEAKHLTLLRDLHPIEARRLAIDLLQAAEEAEGYVARREANS